LCSFIRSPFLMPEGPDAPDFADPQRGFQGAPTAGPVRATVGYARWEHEVVTADDALPVVTLTVEYGYTFPLEGPYRDFDLPTDLLSDLGDWQGFFDAYFDPHAGWDSVQARTFWAGRAEDLEYRLRRALWRRARVEVDLWPLIEGSESALKNHSGRRRRCPMCLKVGGRDPGEKRPSPPVRSEALLGWSDSSDVQDNPDPGILRSLNAGLGTNTHSGCVPGRCARTSVGAKW